jgi:hypothetical protein
MVTTAGKVRTRAAPLCRIRLATRVAGAGSTSRSRVSGAPKASNIGVIMSSTMLRTARSQNRVFA